MQQPALLRYPGAKWTLAPRIVAEFGQHNHYVEPYFGSGAVFFSKTPSPSAFGGSLAVYGREEANPVVCGWRSRTLLIGSVLLFDVFA